MRAGGQTLALLGTPRTYLILRSLAEGAKGRLELRRDAGTPAQSTLRGQLAALETAGVTTKRRSSSFPTSFEYDLTDLGRDLLPVADGLEHWLANAPNGPLDPSADLGRAAIKGLIDGWSATVLGRLAAGPFTLTELDKQISAASYPTIERCLETMRLAGQLEARPRSGRGTPYAITEWARFGLAPLALAARWEHRHRPQGAASLCRSDVEGGFALITPLLEVPRRLAGTCQVAVRTSCGSRQRPLATVEIRGGEVMFGAVDRGRRADVSASAPEESWFSIVIETETRGLRLSGDRKFAQAVFQRVHEALFKTDSAGDAAVTQPGAQG